MEKWVVWIIISLLMASLVLEIDGAFGPPHITVYCMEDYETLHKYINATWKPNPLANFTAEELHDRLQNCEAAVTCSNGHTELHDCPFFNTTLEIYHGWEYDIPINEAYCSIRVTYIDHDNSNDRELTTARGDCTFSAPIPSITVSTSEESMSVGDSKEILCVIGTDKGVNPLAVNITWTGPNGTTITNDRRLTITPTVSNGTNHISTLQFSYLSENDEGLYECNGAVLDLNETESFSLSNFIIPTPIVTLSALNNQQVGDPLLLECNVTTVRGITSSVDIVWSTNNTVVRRFIDTLGEATNNLKVYKDQYTIPGFLVKNNSVYHCQVIIYAKQLTSAGAFMRINLSPSQSILSTSSSNVNSFIKGSALAGLAVSIFVAIMVIFTVLICCRLLGRRKLLQSCMLGNKTEAMSQIASPSIMNIDYSAISREAVSLCENRSEKDFVWSDNLSTVNEQFNASISSNYLTTEEMLNCLHGNRPTEVIIDSRSEDDSGINVSSVEQTSFFTNTTNESRDTHHIINVSEEEKNSIENVAVVSDDKISLEHPQSTNNKDTADISQSPSNCNTSDILEPDPLTININLMSDKDDSVNSNTNDASTIPYENSVETVNGVECPLIKNSFLHNATDTPVMLTSHNSANTSSTPLSQQKCVSLHHLSESNEHTEDKRAVIVEMYHLQGDAPSPSYKSPPMTTEQEGEYIDHDYDIV